MQAGDCFRVFDRSILDYHEENRIDQPLANPYPAGTLEELLYTKNWIDTVQWHLEDLTRVPDAPDSEIARIKRAIDRSNQNRTDTVEAIDDWILNHLNLPGKKPGAFMNSETPAWLLDRMSILALKIFHMKEETVRPDASAEHKERCQQKLEVLLEQKEDLSLCFDELLTDLKTGKRYFKLYRQMKMYNDKNLNPALYARK
ncbi:MAG: DUF4254 domain-containing protein [Spirochaetales bacterium]|nr:DUF4254 domain-containing protein [Spirochaetales bacterium]